MTWTLVKKSEMEALVAFLRPREWECMNLLSRLLKKGLPSFPDPDLALLFAAKADPSAYAGLVYASKHGLLLPYVPAAEPPFDWNGLAKLLEEPKEGFQSIVGTERSVTGVVTGLKLRPAVTIDYNLMKTADGSLPREGFELPEIEVRPAKTTEAELLLPLQESYEKEEVLLRQEYFDPVKTLRELRTSLATQLVFLAEHRGRAVAKGGTNARGLSFDQIGGVYTKPEYRNRKIGHVLVRAVLEALRREGKKSCLFVKKSNLPALSLYKRLGFSQAEDFRISYFFT